MHKTKWLIDRASVSRSKKTQRRFSGPFHPFGESGPDQIFGFTNNVSVKISRSYNLSPRSVLFLSEFLSWHLLTWRSFILPTIRTRKNLFQPLVSTCSFLWSQPVKSHDQKGKFGIVSIALFTLQMLWAANPRTSPPEWAIGCFLVENYGLGLWRCWCSAFLASASVSSDVSSANNKLLITFPSASDELHSAKYFLRAC